MFSNYICGTTGKACSGCSYCCEHRRESAATLENKDNGWIYDRMPEYQKMLILDENTLSIVSDDVLAFVNFGSGYFYTTANTVDGIWYFDELKFYPDAKVVAWMPIPKPVY